MKKQKRDIFLQTMSLLKSSTHNLLKIYIEDQRWGKSLNFKDIHINFDKYLIAFNF